MENDNLNVIIRPNGSRYEYDADFDVYRRIPEPSEMTHMAQFGWIYATVICIVVALVVTLTK